MARVIVEKRSGAKRPTYRVRYGDPATGKLKHHGTYTRRADAVSEAAKVRSQLETGTMFDGSAGRKLTVGQWAEQWSVRAKHRRTSTADRDAYYLRAYWLPDLGERALAAVTPFDVTGIVADMQARLADATVRTAVEVLNRMLGAAVEHRLIAANPCAAVKLRKAPQRSEGIRFLTVDELRRLADAVRPEYRVAIWLGGVMGLRWSEVTGLRVGRCDMLRRRLHVVETTTETINHELIERSEVKATASRRVLPMPPEVVDELAAHLAACGRTGADDLVIVGANGGPPLRGWFRQRIFMPAVALAEVDGLTFHGLRHTSAGLLIQAGAHPEVIRRWMGHADIRTTMTLYGRVSDETIEKSAGAMQALLDGTAGPAAAWAAQ